MANPLKQALEFYEARLPEAYSGEADTLSVPLRHAQTALRALRSLSAAPAQAARADSESWEAVEGLRDAADALDTAHIRLHTGSSGLITSSRADVQEIEECDLPDHSDIIDASILAHQTAHFTCPGHTMKVAGFSITNDLGERNEIGACQICGLEMVRPATSPSAESEARNGCPCLLVGPCSYACSCVSPVQSGGCQRCARYGSPEDRKTAARFIAKAIKQALKEEQE